MPNFFWNKRKPSVAKVTATIEKIHAEFDSASEKLLKEAKEIIAKNKSASKGDRLKSLGFSNAEPVTQSIENRQKQELANLIEYYQQWYPHNKFITEEAVKSICEKYGLVFGEAAYYKGDVPEKNLLEMEAFKLRNEEKERRTNVDDYYTRQRFFAMAQSQSSFGALGETLTLRQDIRRQPTYPPPTEVTEYFVQPPFNICAPEKDFDTRFMVKKDGYKLEYDPIVLQPVKGGYLCVTKWGIEASDEIVTNPISN